MLDRNDAILLLTLVLDNLESCPSGDQPSNRLTLLELPENLFDAEIDANRFQSVGRKLRDDYNLI